MPEENKTKSILNIVRKLPLFTINDIPDVGVTSASVRVKLYRLAKAGKIIRIKRGSYVSSAYLEHIRSTGMIDTYLEFLATSIYEPAYLSVEYVLQKHGILSESVQAITVITTNKKNRFINTLGIFTYRQVGENLFTGFNVEEKDGFVVSMATVAKALFDFLYLRKNLIKDKNAFENLRLNLDLLSANDLKEFTKYVNKENSKKMRLLESFIRQN
ncbi:MAG TPA: hypothetical protein ENJ75_00405 [Candidatus Kaiserbacteria bacterium]|nr:hypothetical protein [Candidatus Kaiserbacteria bacterium]